MKNIEPGRKKNQKKIIKSLEIMKEIREKVTLF